MADFINALRQGMADQTDWQEGDTRRKAGNAFAGGDYGAASGILAQQGMLPEAAQMQGYGQQQQAGQAEAARKEMKDRAEWMLNGVNGLMAAPADQREQVFEQHLAPTLQAMGVPPEVISRLKASPKDDATLRAFAASLGQEAAKLQMFNTRNGVVGVDSQSGQSRMLYEAPPERPNVPAGYRMKPDGSLEYIPGGPADPSVVGDRARAGWRPRAAPRGRSGTAARPVVPSGFILD